MNPTDLLLPLTIISCVWTLVTSELFTSSSKINDLVANETGLIQKARQSIEFELNAIKKFEE